MNSKVRVRPEEFWGQSEGLTEKQIKELLDAMHRDFAVKEIEVNGVLYRWPMVIHDENCR